MIRTPLLYAFFSIALALFACSSPASAKGVGLLRLDTLDPVSSKPMDVAVFYPTLSSNTISAIGPYDIDAGRQLAIAPGAYPLLIISHGSSGGLWGHHTLASNLARMGVIVITLTHPGDNYLDSSGAGAISTVYGRPLQVSAALDAALKMPFLASSIDTSRIAFMGFSSGGQTGLLLAGAKPDFSRLEAYCASRPGVELCKNEGKIRIDKAELSPMPDARIRAFILMAPLSVSFSPETLRGLDAPMLLYTGENDQELDPTENAYSLARELPRLFAIKTIPKAGHFVFLAACSDRMLQISPSICTDTPFTDRVALHKEMSVEISDFLSRAFSSVALP